MLNLDSISVNYGKGAAVKNVSIEVPQGSIIGIIGANGAGKSTVLKAISGLVLLSGGEIRFTGTKINAIPTHRRVKLGIVHIPEGRRLFPYMTVIGNLKIGAYLRKDKAGIQKDLDEILERFPVLNKRRNQVAATLSGGEQQMLAIGRGLMAKPKLLLMDEPSLGLAPLMINLLAEVIRDINKTGISILLVEQNVGLVTKVASTGYILEVGKVILEGNIKDVISSDIVKKGFLGDKSHNN